METKVCLKCAVFDFPFSGLRSAGIGSAAVTFGPDEIRVSEDGESEIFTIRSSGDVSGIRKP